VWLLPDRVLVLGGELAEAARVEQRSHDSLAAVAADRRDGTV
jgi:hypothetical protein